jgi:4-amino-4-deoxy-L-arabinose transferase-like glycosyltransferase
VTRDETPRRRNAGSLWLAVVLALGIAARVAYVDRPFDHRIRTAWAQSDSLQIARNFFREGMNIFYPRIDWRGDTPGYVETALPVLPWTAALLYHVVGYHEMVLRFLSAVLEVLTLLLFAWWVRTLLPIDGALVATAAFALNPLLVYFATAMQPEPLMHLFSLIAVVLLVRWMARPASGVLIAAAGTAAFAILAKPQAAFLVPLAAYAILRRRGLAPLTDPRTYAAVALMLLPPLAWYGWAHHLWTTYGNSLGLSNEAHRIGLDLIVPPKFLTDNLGWDTIAVFTPPGLLLAIVALGSRDRAATIGRAWYLAVWVVYVAAARTALDPFGGFNYHSASVAPGSLLLGAGFSALVRGDATGGWGRLVQRLRPLAAVLGYGTIACLVATVAVLIYLRDYGGTLGGMRSCALEFASHVPPEGRIVVNGGGELDDDGFPIAHHAPMFFAWMDRKGFSYANEDLSLEALEAIEARGGQYWIAGHDELRRQGLGERAAQRYRLVTDCAGGYSLFDLTARGNEGQDSNP